jgi:hypothetical protein
MVSFSVSTVPVDWAKAAAGMMAAVAVVQSNTSFFTGKTPSQGLKQQLLVDERSLGSECDGSVERQLR